VESSFTQMLLKKVLDVVDGNPVKVAFIIAKLSSRKKTFVTVFHSGA